MKAHRLSFILFLYLLASNVTIGIYCHTMQGTHAIQTHVINHLLSRETSWGQDCTKLAHKLYRISYTVLTDLSKESLYRKLEDFNSFLWRFIKKLAMAYPSNVDIGVTIGFACVSRIFDVSVTADNALFYFRSIFSRLHDEYLSIERNEAGRWMACNFISFVLLGMLMGALKAGDSVQGRKIGWWEKIEFLKSGAAFKDGLYTRLCRIVIEDEKLGEENYRKYLRDLALTMSGSEIIRGLEPDEFFPEGHNDGIRAVFMDAEPELLV